MSMIRSSFAGLFALVLAACPAKEAPRSPAPAGKAEAPVPSPKAATPAPAGKEAGRVVEVTVTKKGFEPSPIPVKRGEPVTLVITRTVEKTCATDVVIPGYDVKAALPLNEPVRVTFTPTTTGDLVYGCSMDQMVGGVLRIE